MSGFRHGIAEANGIRVEEPARRSRCATPQAAIAESQPFGRLGLYQRA